ncbi:MAG: SET domain-containing protein-lysine N-methyltransferase [Proteobacteria bacterium]|nr:SET domain-containing protein-lysine N-methyltransferase [Pseudomonadota bacterium]
MPSRTRAPRRASPAAARTHDRPKTEQATRPYAVRRSPIHGRGVFATRAIAKGEDIVEYRGRRISADAADTLPDSDPDNPYHTFLFELNDGRVIDAGVRGNAARWINHSCAPNCEPYEDDRGRVIIAARRTIRAGEELAYDYRLNVEGRRTKALLAAYRCRCGARRCRGSMLDPAKAPSPRGSAR